MLNFFSIFSSCGSSVILICQNRKSHFFIGPSQSIESLTKVKELLNAEGCVLCCRVMGSTFLSQTQVRQASYPTSYKQAPSWFLPQCNGALKSLMCQGIFTRVLGQDTSTSLPGHRCCPLMQKNLFSWQNAITEVLGSVETAEDVAAFIQGTLPFC